MNNPEIVQVIMVLLGVIAVVLLYRRIQGLSGQQRTTVLVINLVLVLLLLSALQLPLATLLVVLLLTNVAVIGFMGQKEEVRLRQMNDQLVNALLIISGALKAGRTLEQGIELASRSLPDPIAGEFKSLLAEIELGISFDSALRALLERVPGQDFKLFVTATLFQRETGGNLIALYNQITFAVSERKKVLGRLEAITLQQRYSAYVVMGLPIALYLVLSILNPAHVAVLHHDPLGQLAFYCAIVLQILGIIILRAILSRNVAA